MRSALRFAVLVLLSAACEVSLGGSPPPQGGMSRPTPAADAQPTRFVIGTPNRR